MPRIFTGLEIPETVAQTLSMLRGGLPGARWIDPENYHLTLRFIGDVDDQTAREVASLLGRVRRGADRAALRRAVVVRRPPAARGDRDAGADAGADGAAGRARAADAARRARAGGPQIHAACHARAAARSRRAAQVADYLATRALIAPLPFTVSRFVLFSSRASVGGGPYVVEAGLSAGGVTALLPTAARRAMARAFRRSRMPSDVKARYAALVAAGEIERDPAQAQASIVLDRARRRGCAEHRLARKSSSLGWLFGARERAAGADQGPLPLRRGRARQVHADGPVLRGLAGRAQAARAFPRVHGATCTSASRRFRDELKSAAIRRRSDPARRGGDRARTAGSCASTNSTSPTSPTR